MDYFFNYLFLIFFYFFFVLNFDFCHFSHFGPFSDWAPTPFSLGADLQLSGAAYVTINH